MQQSPSSVSFLKEMNPVWKESQALGDTVLARCEPIPLRLTGVRIMFEPSSWDESTAAKNIYFEIPDGDVRAFLEDEESKLDRVKSCLAKPGLIKCKMTLNKVRVFDLSKQVAAAPAEWSKWVANVMINFTGTWKRPDCSGLSLYATDIQLIKQHQPTCPF